MDFLPDTWGEVLEVLAVLTIALAVLDWRIGAHVTKRVGDLKAELQTDLAERTRPIQPGFRNGGESLADVAFELRRIRQHLGMDT